MTTRRRFLSATAALSMVSAAGSRAQAASTIRVARIQGVNFLPTHVMQRRKLVEKHAARLGIANGRAE